MKMTHTIFSVVAVAFMAAPAHALVREIAKCTTANGKYEVSVQDNQGIGPIRKSNMGAVVEDANGTVVASYKVEPFQGIQSASFGRPKIQDSATKGGAFLLEGTSTNFKNYVLHVKLNSNGARRVIADANLNCSVFGGIVLGQ